MSFIKDGNVNLITTRHVSATLMSAIKENPGAKGFIISGILSMKTHINMCICIKSIILSARIPSVYAGHLRVPGAHRKAGRRDPHKLAPLHPREADSEWIQGLATVSKAVVTIFVTNPKHIYYLARINQPVIGTN